MLNTRSVSRTDPTVFLNFVRNLVLHREDACSGALSTGEIDLVHIAAVPSGVVAAFEKLRNVDTYRLISFRPSVVYIE